MRLLISIILIFGVSCAHVQSGHYIQVQKGDNWNNLSKEYHVSVENLQAANPDKKLVAGVWILIPLARGFLVKVLEKMGKRYPSSQEDSQNPSESPEIISQNSRYLWPVPSSRKISSYFGPRGGRHHDGVDIPAKRGEHILAAESGKVIYSGNGIRGYGNLTILSHPGNLFTVYAHATKNYTRKNQKVRKGQVIALIGNTGHSTGPHLHFEVRKNEKKVDPLYYIPDPNSRGKLQLARR